MSCWNTIRASTIHGPYYGRPDIGPAANETFIVNCMGCNKRVHVDELGLRKDNTPVCGECRGI